MRAHDVAAAGRTLALGARPWLMGIVNATPDSFSDAGATPTLDARVALALELVAEGADIIDVGGESGVTRHRRWRSRRRSSASSRSSRGWPGSGVVVSVDT